MQKDSTQPNTREAEKIDLHASAVVIGEAGVLITGPSGAGKSSLAIALVEAARAAGTFARLIGDDRIHVACASARLIARGHPRIEGKIERRGQGIVAMPFLGAAVIRLVIRFAGDKEVLPRLPEEKWIVLAGVQLPLLEVRHDAAPQDLAARILADPRLWKR